MTTPAAPTSTPTSATPDPSPTAPADGSSGRIVVGVDGSEPSKQALRWAAFIASTTGASIDAIASWRLNAFASGPALIERPAEWDRTKEINAMLEATLEDVFADSPPARLNSIVQEGVAAKVLIEASEGARMLLVGSRGHGGFVGLMLGSVSTACAAHASCPVMVIHGDTPAPPPL